MKKAKIYLLISIAFIVISSLQFSCKKFGSYLAIKTGEAININASGAEVDAVVIDVGESGLSEHGWCIGTSPDPTINDNKVNNGPKESYGNYTNTITGLNPGTKYYVRSYISGGGQTVYGEELEFTTSELDFKINYPTTNSIIGTGQTYNIKWTANINDKLKIELYKSNIYYKSIVEDIENSGEYSWEVAIDLKNADDYKLVISSTENGGIKEESFTFSIYDNAPPSVTTGEITNIDYFAAQASGKIEHFGTESSVIQHGHCWSMNENPTIEDNKTELGNKNTLDTFTSNLSNLTDNTSYYVRTYASNDLGTTYGEQILFTTTDAVKPTVTTVILSDINYTTASCEGEVTNIGTHEVTARGVCWSTSANPTTANNYTTDGYGVGSFTSSIIDLAVSTTYYVRAYATNSVGTAYGEQKTIITLDLESGITDVRDGTHYNIVLIGKQVWIAENLKYLPSVTRPDESSETSPHYYVYDYNGTIVDDAKATANYTIYGILYNWPAAMNNAVSSSTNPSGVQGACPTGWHLPSKSEWIQLTDYLGGAYIAGGKLKEAGTIHWNTGNTGTNESGFTALPGGIMNSYMDRFEDIRNSCQFWLATEEAGPYSPNLSYYGNIAGFKDGYNPKNGYSVRCIKD